MDGWGEAWGPGQQFRMSYQQIMTSSHIKLKTESLDDVQTTKNAGDANYLVGRANVCFNNYIMNYVLK